MTVRQRSLHQLFRSQNGSSARHIPFCSPASFAVPQQLSCTSQTGSIIGSLTAAQPRLLALSLCARSLSLPVSLSSTFASLPRSPMLPFYSLLEHPHRASVLTSRDRRLLPHAASPCSAPTSTYSTRRPNRHSSWHSTRHAEGRAHTAGSTQRPKRGKEEPKRRRRRSSSPVSTSCSPIRPRLARTVRRKSSQRRQLCSAADIPLSAPRCENQSVVHSPFPSFRCPSPMSASPPIPQATQQLHAVHSAVSAARHSNAAHPPIHPSVRARISQSVCPAQLSTAFCLSRVPGCLSPCCSQTPLSTFNTIRAQPANRRPLHPLRCRSHSPAPTRP